MYDGRRRCRCQSRCVTGILCAEAVSITTQPCRKQHALRRHRRAASLRAARLSPCLVSLLLLFHPPLSFTRPVRRILLSLAVCNHARLLEPRSPRPPRAAHPRVDSTRLLHAPRVRRRGRARLQQQQQQRLGVRHGGATVRHVDRRSVRLQPYCVGERCQETAGRGSGTRDPDGARGC